VLHHRARLHLTKQRNAGRGAALLAPLFGFAEDATAIQRFATCSVFRNTANNTPWPQPG
jgi:hypothetical protein